MPHWDKFWTRVDASAGAKACWPWLGARDRQGYGQIWWQGPRLAHRVAALLSGIILALETAPDNLVLHQCDNPSCCNPVHLRRGDAGRNQIEAYSRGLKLPPQRRGERNSNARLTADQVRLVRAKFTVGGVTKKSLGQEYGVSRGTISNVVRGVHYADVV